MSFYLDSDGVNRQIKVLKWWVFHAMFHPLPGSHRDFKSDSM